MTDESMRVAIAVDFARVDIGNRRAETPLLPIRSRNVSLSLIAPLLHGREDPPKDCPL